MNRSDKSQSTSDESGEEAFVDITSLSEALVKEMLLRMIESAADYYGWTLSDEDGVRVVKLLKGKQRIVCSSFGFQMRKHFEDFRTGVAEKSARDWQKIGLDSGTGAAETAQLQDITDRYQEAFREFDRTILKRLQACIKRSRASVYENPLQVKKLCEAFQYAIDSLNLQVHCKVALYQLFADRYIESLGPLYRRLDRALLERGMMTELPLARIHLRSIEGLSESESADTMQPDQTICLLMLFQRFKEKTRKPTGRFSNLFPELRQKLGQFGFDQFDEQIEQLSMIFKLIFEDEDLPSPVKQQLSRLQIFVFITATQEDGFLRRSSNPARRLLDGIIGSEVEIVRKGNPEFSGIRYIREHIDSLTNQKFITLDSYGEMLDGYHAFVKDNERAIRKSRKAEATRRIMPIVKERLAEITRPLQGLDESMILFEKVWLPLLLQIGIQQGTDSDPWHKTVSMVKTQVWSMIPKSTKEEHVELMRALPQVEKTLHRAMRSLRLAETLQQSMRDYLKLQQQNVTENTVRNIEEAKRRTRSLAAQSFDAMKDSTEFDAMMQTGQFMVTDEMLVQLNEVKPAAPKKINMASALTKGEWVNIIQGGQKLLAKLTWKSEDNSLFIFVDREGKRICEIDAETLERRFESGDLSLMDAGSSGDSEKTQFSIMKQLR